MTRKSKKFGLFLGSCLMLLVLCGQSLAAQTQDPAEGMIEGAITNKTPVGGEVENQEIILHINRDASEIEELSTRTNSSGGFEFPDLFTDEDYSYYLSLDYQGGEYQSDTVSFEKEQRHIILDLIVYDSTTSDEKIMVDIDHLVILKAEEGFLLVSEALVFNNTGDKTYIGEKDEVSGVNQSLRISLPVDFHDLEYVRGLMDCCASQTEDGIIDSMDIKPGPKAVTIRYKLDYSSKSYLFTKLLDYTTTNFYILAPTVFQTASDSLILEGPVEIEGRPYTALGLEEEMFANSRITVEISDLPSQGWRFTHTAIFGLIAFFVVLGLAYPLLKKSKTSKKQASQKRIKPAEAKEDLEAERKTLLSLIAHLDDQFEAKEVPEHLYREMRKEFKEKLVKIMQALAKRGKQK
ncbi:hypothetical protein LCGC14_1660700 [marine sediment metagenome]|uniref:Carboxypeptidase regulatory-like domain-containing protein n=1 Tax=marine sediment metagenome TaxID=412755 RepID=A0A0F9HU66_9ZZZZ